jgi:hypothetical protein
MQRLLISSVVEHPINLGNPGSIPGLGTKTQPQGEIILIRTSLEEISNIGRPLPGYDAIITQRGTLDQKP